MLVYADIGKHTENCFRYSKRVDVCGGVGEETKLFILSIPICETHADYGMQQ